MFIKQRACKPIKYNEGKERSKMEVTEKQIPFGQNEILDLPNGVIISKAYLAQNNCHKHQNRAIERNNGC